MISKFIEEVRRSNRLVVGGMFFYDSPGHMIAESDLLLRLIHHYPLIRSRSPIVVLPPTQMATMISELLTHNGVQVILDPNAFSILREIQIFHPDLVLEVGQAHCKLVVPDTQNRKTGDLYPLNLCWSLRRDEYLMQNIRWHEAWNLTRGYLPLRDGLQKIAIDPGFEAVLTKQKYAVIQIKAAVINGTARVLSGETFCPSLELLKDNGYSLILAGREPLPPEFRRFEIYDYPRSKFASPRNDFFLFSRASLGVISPSGAGLFCDALGVPYCQYGSYSLIPHPSEKTVAVPSRMRDLKSSQILTFSQQAWAFRGAYHEVAGPGYFDRKNYDDVPPSPADIRAGVDEIIHGTTLPYPLEAIRRLDPVGMWRAAGCKFSSAFLAAHPEYLA